MTEDIKTFRTLFFRNLRSWPSLFSLILILLLASPPYWFKPIMWIVAEKNELVLREIVQELTKNATTDLEKAQKIYEWFESGNLTNIYWNTVRFADPPIYIYEEPPHICIRLIGHEYPLWVLTSRCGACEEYALLYMEMASEAGLKVRSIHDHGENHNWDEVLINGKWIIVDPSRHKFNESLSYYERGRGLNVSYVFALYPNGSTEDVTRRYTNVGTVHVKVIDANGKNIRGATIEVISNNYKPNWRVILECRTDETGECIFQIGGGNYTLRTYARLFLFNETNLIISEGKSAEITIVVTRNLSAGIIRYLNNLTIVFLIIGILGWLFMNLIRTGIQLLMASIKKEK